MNETTVGFAVHILVAGRTIQVPALILLNLFQPHVLLATFRTATSTKAHGGLGVVRWFARMVNSEMHLETSLSKKVAMTLSTTSRGFETSWVSFQEIGAGFLATGPALAFLGAPMMFLGVIGFPTVGTHVTGSENSWQTGNDIVKRYREKKRVKMAGAKKRSQATSREEALARRRAIKARYRAKYPDKVAAAKKRYRENNREKIREANKRYYYTHREQRRAYDRTQTGVDSSISSETSRGHRGEKKRTAKQGETENFGKTQSLRPSSPGGHVGGLFEIAFGEHPGRNVLGYLLSTPPFRQCDTNGHGFRVLHPLDHLVWDPSSSEDSLCDGSSDDLSSFCDMPPPDGSQWLDELMEDLSELSSSSSSDDSFYDLLKDMSPDKWAQLGEDIRDPSFNLDDFVSMFPDDDINDVIEDMSLNEWEQFMDSFDLDDFVL